MRLQKKIGRATIWSVLIAMAAVFGCLMKLKPSETFAEGEETAAFSRFVTEGAKFVIFYDDGEKLTVRTEAATVAEALKRANIELTAGDKVEPAVETEIDADNFFINIYRARPVVVKDGMFEKYLMTASHDMKTIATEAGLTVYDGDEIELKRNGNFLESGAANIYEVTRNGGQTITVEEEIAFGTETVKDYNLTPGVSEVRQLGETGLKRMQYNVLYMDGVEISRELMTEETIKEPVTRIVAEGASPIEQTPLTAGRGVNQYTIEAHGETVLRKETYYDLPMTGVMAFCGKAEYTVREDGAKVDEDGYVLVAADLTKYPRCSVVETSLGPGKVYDTGSFVLTNSEQFDLATDWTNRDGR